jgi:hypothetical protein
MIRNQAPASPASSTLRALYIVESDTAEAVVELAARLPATQRGATVEIWPLTEPSCSARIEAKDASSSAMR